MALGVYNPEVYNSLVEVDKVQSKSGYNRDFLPQLGRVIKDYKWENDIAISLVHRHFDISPNERMVADYDLEKMQWISKPILSSESNLIPWSWKIHYNEIGKKWSLFPLDFLPNTSKYEKERELVKRLMLDNNFLNELILAMVTIGVSDVFGIALLMSRFNDLTPEFVMFEKNDRKTKTSNSFFIPANSLSNPEAITQWHFRTESAYIEGPGVLKWCDHL